MNPAIDAAQIAPPPTRYRIRIDRPAYNRPQFTYHQSQHQYLLLDWDAGLMVLACKSYRAFQTLTLHRFLAPGSGKSYYQLDLGSEISDCSPQIVLLRIEQLQAEVQALDFAALKLRAIQHAQARAIMAENAPESGVIGHAQLTQTR
jgi:hypothetical protein